MGFIANWFGGKSGASLADAALMPQSSIANASKPNLEHAFASELSKIMPRDGECSMAVSGLDGVLTVGKDMTMTTDQPIYCQTLRVLGTLEATVHAHKIIIAESGRVMGSVRVNEAEILGEFDGSLQVRGTLAVFPSATLIGKVRATEISLAKQAKVSAADIKRVVPKVLDGVDFGPMTDGRFEDGYSSMSITVSQKSAIRA
jgi:cytoskeletal protein CcmA (bactofilin family)